MGFFDGFKKRKKEEKSETFSQSSDYSGQSVSNSFRRIGDEMFEIVKQKENEAFIREYGCSKETYELLKNYIERLKKYDSVEKCKDLVRKNGEAHCRDELEQIKDDISNCLVSDSTFRDTYESISHQKYAEDGNKWNKAAKKLYEFLVNSRIAEKYLNWAIEYMRRGTTDFRGSINVRQYLRDTRSNSSDDGR